MAAIVHAGYESIPVDPMRPYVPASYFPDAPVCARNG